jgi:parallel beta-helix repeat protein
MRRNAFLISLLGLVLALCVTKDLYAADVLGPYDNTQTYLEYSAIPTQASWLYAINCVNQDLPSYVTPDGTTYRLYNTWNTGTGRWDVKRLYNSAGTAPLQIAPVSMLSRNSRPIMGFDFQRMDILGHGLGQMAQIRQSNGPLGQWQENGDFNDGQMRPTRLVVSRVPKRQWAAGEWLFHGFFNRGRTTTDGWNSHSVIEGNGLPFDPPPSENFGYGFHTLAIDDRDIPSQVIGVVTRAWFGGNELGQLQNSIGVLAREFGVYRTCNRGTDWTQVTVPGWTDAMWNVQVAMIKSDPNNPNGSYKLYLVGTDLTDPNNPQIFCRWADWLCNGNPEFEWHNSMNPTGISPGMPGMPTYAFDLAAEWDPNASRFNLLLSTSNSIYFAAHDGTTDMIPWVARMNGIATQNFRKITVDPTSRYNHFAVAGMSCSYATADAGQTWTPLWNSGRMIQYPTGGTCEGVGTHPMMSLYTGPQVYSATAYDPMLIQTAPHYSAMPPMGAYSETRQIGWTFSGTTNNHVTVSRVDNRYYAGFADPYSANGTVISKGIIFVSSDDGANWLPGAWPVLFSTDQTAAPAPSRIVADPNFAGHAYVTFYNAHSGLNAVPPLAFTVDGGTNWIIPANNNLPLGVAGRYLATGTDAGTAYWYITTDTQLWFSNSMGTDWIPVTLPVQMTGEAIVAVTCNPEAARSMAVAGRNFQTGASHIAITADGGLTWIVHSSPADRVFQNLVGEPSLFSTDPSPLWAILMGSNFIPTLMWTNDNGQSWRVVEKWGDEMLGTMPDVTGIFFERAAGDITRRVIWTATQWSEQNAARVASPASVKIYVFPILPTLIAQSMTITQDMSPVYMNGTTTVASGATLTIDPGVTLYAARCCSLIVRGNLVAGSGAVFGRLDSNGVSDRWSGIYVTGSANLTGCAISGANIGVSLSKSTGNVTISSCDLNSNDIGIFVYSNPFNMTQTIESCLIHDNEREGISLLASKNLTLFGNQVYNNGGSGILAMDAAATLNENEIHNNGGTHGGYGLECFGSSPVLYCNDFQNNKKGEIGLSNQSYPVLWDDGGLNGGANSLLNATKTLITMWDSYPVIKNGKNNFWVGPTGYFLADMSTKPPKHDISENYWNPTLSYALLYPSSASVWTWNSVSPEKNDCGEEKGLSQGGVSALFEQGFTAEGSGNLPLAQSLYSQIIAGNSDSALAMAAAARLFDLQRGIDSAYTSLQAFFDNVAGANPEDTTFVTTANALATRLYVEDSQYDPALTTYQQVMTNPPSPVDSIYAALDFAVTAFRAQYDSSRGGLDSYIPVVAMSTVSDLLQRVSDILPAPPQTLHEGYSLPPTTYVLEQNFPNPFNATTTIRYYLPEASNVKIEVFNITGQKAATLIDGHQSAGYQRVTWNPDVSSGVYFYRLEAAEQVLSRKMVLLK